MKQGSKTYTTRTEAASILAQRSGKAAPMAGQAARTEALREARTAKVKDALSKASSSSRLFK